MDEQALVCVITDCRIQGIQLQIRPKNPTCASGILSLPQKSDTYVRPLATGQSQTVMVDEQQGSSTDLGKFWGARTEVQGETN